MSKGTTRRSIRVEDELWNSAKAEFNARGKNISDEIRIFLREEVEGGLLASPHAHRVITDSGVVRAVLDELDGTGRSGDE